MRMHECTCEAAVVNAVVAGRWPTGADADLRTHVEGCEACAEVARVAQAMADIDAAALEQVDLPSAGQIWWRAKVRARAEAARAAERPMLFVQAVTGTCALAALAALGAAVWPWMAQFATRLQSQVPAGFTWSASLPLPVIVALAAVAVAAPIALYMALARE